MSNELEIFFPTKNRDYSLEKCLESINNHHPSCTITIANCSSNTEETSKILKRFSNVNEIILSPDPGMVASFNILIKMLTKKLVLWLSDDLILSRSLTPAIEILLKNEHVMSVGLGLNDNIHFNDQLWPVDKHGCALWNSDGRRVAHFALVKKNHIEKVNLLVTRSNAIDLALHNSLNNDNSIWFDGQSFIEHHRFMDETRRNRLW